LWIEYFDFLICPIQEAWVFFIDDAPMANWAHPCRYVWFEVNTGEYIVIEDSWPPEYFFDNQNLFLEFWDRIYTIDDIFTREEAIQIIVNEVVGPDSLEINHLYSKYDSMELGDTLWLADYYLGYYIMPYETQWVFFIDDNPIVFWTHPCRYVFFDSFSGEYEIHEDGWPPHPYFEGPTAFLEEWEWILSVNIESAITNDDGLELFPNPCKTFFHLKFHNKPDNITSISITNMQGKVIMQKELKNLNETKINLQELDDGIYLVNTWHNNILVHQKKLIKIN